MKALALLSGGIDSPVAMHLMMKRGLDVVAVHFDSNQFSDKKTSEKASLLVKRISEINNKKIKLYFVEHGRNLAEIRNKTNSRFTCVLCKRMMFKIAERLAEKEACQFLVTGESLGQVASQTLDNMIVISQATSMDILRPLLAMDKNETIEIAKEIGTYEISTLPSIACKAVPKYPATKTKIDMVKNEEQKISINKLMEEAIKNAKLHTC